MLADAAFLACIAFIVSIVLYWIGVVRNWNRRHLSADISIAPISETAAFRRFELRCTISNGSNDAIELPDITCRVGQITSETSSNQITDMSLEQQFEFNRMQVTSAGKPTIDHPAFPRRVHWMSIDGRSHETFPLLIEIHDAKAIAIVVKLLFRPRSSGTMYVVKRTLRLPTILNS